MLGSYILLLSSSVLLAAAFSNQRACVPGVATHMGLHATYARQGLNMQVGAGTGASPCKIKVVGVGGGGGNAVNRIIESAQTVGGVEMWAVNTDTQALQRNLAEGKVIIGKITSRGLGAGGNPSVGREVSHMSHVTCHHVTYHTAERCTALHSSMTNSNPPLLHAHTHIPGPACLLV